MDNKFIVIDKIKNQDKAKLYIKFIKFYLNKNSNLDFKECEVHHIIPKSLGRR